ncbi:hypothetical protein KC207_10035 [Phycicoccus sp. BSK3Z-2]|uniref:Beta-lactamase class A catalytic domain-containing protein n=1 Tax=Phycicoccus avicenniae TaxID=2828860 RepID=A0A941D9L4_9MICO|nr:serine hydrolase [Phycicoccus avicenniae]MBR7743628.1 hypothetical protein [Phycicoccus avicenniae]
MLRPVPALLLVALLAAACGTTPSDPGPTTDATPTPPGPVTAPTPSGRPEPAAEDVVVTGVPKPEPVAPPPAAGPAPEAAGGGGGVGGSAGDALTSLEGDTRSAIVYAPLSNPSAVTTEGSVPSVSAWSTSKVLVVAAYLDTVVGGDPSQVPDTERGLIASALTASDGNAVVAIRDRIPGSPGAAITQVLRDVGDGTTVAPDRSQGLMAWSPREQVRFMAALAAGRVVSPAASEYLLSQMQPIAAHRWGLGRIGASAMKGGWLRSDTETRQMGIVGGYAVAIITVGVGPAVVQTDGDAAHVWQMDRMADLLARRIS